jgi:cobalt-precorrin-5B (C1)-methyltransferase
MGPPREGMRTGYTTGACATAATRAALLALLRQQPLDHIVIRLPAGQEADFSLHSCSFTQEEGRASIIKDAGDDPDVTHGAEVRARVCWTAGEGVVFRAGEGVGMVTKPGLPVPPGEPAINPGPREMIAATVAEVLAEAGLPGRGVVVEISIPGGEELARKTFNPRLGIVGGLSILGTTGIVVPYSTAAWLASVVQGIDVAAAQGYRHVVLTVGERGERFARRLVPLPEDAFVQIGPFFGDALRHCARTGMARVTLAAMVGKLAKFAAGNESVHNTQSAQDFAFLADLAAQAGGAGELLEQVRAANTAQEVGALLLGQGLMDFFPLLCRRAWDFAVHGLGVPFVLEVLTTGQDGALLGRYPPDTLAIMPTNPGS